MAINFERVRRLASSMRRPSMSFSLPSPYEIYRLGRRLEEESQLTRKQIRDLLEYGAIDLGITSLGGISGLTDLRSKGQKQLDTLKERLEKSGQEVPEPESAGRQGFIGEFIEALGAPSGAVTTLLYDLIAGTGRNPLQSIRAGITGEGRKVGSDILEALGVKNRIAQGVGGFALDVLLDPTTYIGIGATRHAGTVTAKSLAMKAVGKSGGPGLKGVELDDLMKQALDTSDTTPFRTDDPRVASIAREFGRPVKEHYFKDTPEYKSLYDELNRNLDDVKASIAQKHAEKQQLGSLKDLRAEERAIKSRIDELRKKEDNLQTEVDLALYQDEMNELQRRLQSVQEQIQRVQQVNQELRDLYAIRNQWYDARRQLREAGKKAEYEIIREVYPHIPRQYNLQIGIPFTNITKDVADLTPLFDRMRQKIKQPLFSNNPFVRQMAQMGAKAGNILRRAFSAYPAATVIANLARQHKLKVDGAVRQAIVQGENLNKMVGGSYAEIPDVHRAIAFKLDVSSVLNKSINYDELPENFRRQAELADQMFARLPEDVRQKTLKAAEILEKEFDLIEKREIEHGILAPDQVRRFYFTHLVQGDPEALREFKAQFAGRQPYQFRTTGQFQRRRNTPTFTELEAFVREFNATHPHLPDISINYDIGQVLATRKLASEVLIQNKKLIDNLINLGEPYVIKRKGRRPVPGYVNLQGVSPELDKYLLDSDTAKFLEEWMLVSAPDGGFEQLMQTWDKVMEIYKAYLTATPGFHIRNALGTFWNNWIMGVKDPRYYKDAFELVTRGKTFKLEPDEEFLASKTFQLPDGRTLTGKDVIDLATQFGLLRAGFAADFGQQAVERLGKDTRLRRALRLEFSRKFGETVEDVARLAGFIQQLERHGDPWSAAIEVKKHLFDYSELSKFEKKYLRRFVLFYTWMRKNIPLQIEALMRKPGMYTGLEHAMTEGSHIAGVEPEEMPEYLADSATIPLLRLPDGKVLTTSQTALPAADLFEWLRNVDNPSEFLGHLISTLAPPFSTAAEIAANRQMFSGMPIDPDAEISGGPPSGTAILNYLFRQTGLPYNIFRSITGRNELIPTEVPQEGEKETEDGFVYRSYAPFDISQPWGVLGLFAQYDPQYWQENVLPYRYASELREHIRRLTRKGETVYTKQELDQAEALGLDPEQVRFMRQLLDEMGLPKSKENLMKLYYSTGGNLQQLEN